MAGVGDLAEGNRKFISLRLHDSLCLLCIGFTCVEEKSLCCVFKCLRDDYCSC